MTDGIPDYGKIAAKWASQYADQPDGATLASWAKRRASEYETEAEELGTEANFIEHLDFQYHCLGQEGGIESEAPGGSNTGRLFRHNGTYGDSTMHLFKNKERKRS
jgi:hypothetical protein